MTETSQSLRQLAITAAKNHPDPKQGVAEMVRQIEANNKLKKALFQELLRTACLTAFHSARAGLRREAKSSIPLTKRSGDVIAMASGPVKRAILDSWIVNDEPLGDVMCGQLAAYAAAETAKANGHYQNAMFYESIHHHRNAKDDKPVRQCLSDDMVEQLWRDVFEGHFVTETQRSNADLALAGH